MDKSPDKISQVIKEITKKDKSKFKLTNHIALSLCHNILGDTVRLKEQQQLMMEKGQMQDWIIKISLELYKLAGERFGNNRELEEINKIISQKGVNEEIELDKAQYLLRTEKFDEAQKIADKYLAINDKNLKALLLKADLEMAFGNLDKMKLYEDKARQINPKVFPNTKK